jgi:large subunit ribosomal protein L3
MLGHFIKSEVPAKRHTASFQVSEEHFLPIGYVIGPSHFKIGNFVDVKGNSKGKGTQGTIKKWNFSHQNFTHGNSKAHRKPGALQGAEFPGKVFKGKKMAGKMGNESATHFNCKVVKIDNPRSLIYLKGPVPGAIGGMIKLRDAHKKRYKQQVGNNDTNIGIDTWEGDEEDPFEKYDHDNVGVAGPDNEED